MVKHGIFPNDGARPRGSYSPGVRAGDFVFVSGQGPLDPATGEVVGSDIATQVQQTMRNVERIVAAAGGTMDQVVRVDAHLAHLSDFAAYDTAYRQFFHDDLPARTTVEARIGDILVEISAVVYVPRLLNGDGSTEQ